MAIALNDVVEIQINGTVAAGGSNSRASKFTYHYRLATLTTTPTKVALDTIFQTTVATPLAALLNNRWLQANNSVRDVNDATDPPVFFAHALAGLIAGDGLSTVLAAFHLFRTAKKGKSYRGGKHYFPLSEADVTAASDDILNAAAVILHGNLLAAEVSAMTDALGNVWVPCILSRTLSTLRSNPTTVISNDITFALLNKRIGRMRHREVKSVY